MNKDWKKQFRDKWEGGNNYNLDGRGLPTVVMDQMIKDIEDLLAEVRENKKQVNRLEILIGRMRACNETTNKHDLSIDEANDWIGELKGEK